MATVTTATGRVRGLFLATLPTATTATVPPGFAHAVTAKAATRAGSVRILANMGFVLMPPILHAFGAYCEPRIPRDLSSLAHWTPARTECKGKTMPRKRRFLGTLLALTTLGLLACATTPYEGDGKARSDALLQKQFASAEQHRSASSGGRLILAGFAMHSQSKAFRNDVLSAEKAVLAIDPNAIVFKLDNPVLGQAADWPYATGENIELVLRKVSALARADDKIVVLMATHGNVDALAINFGNQDYPYIGSRWLGQALEGLRGKPTLLLLSACYSGSFVEPLSRPERIILTAAARDRNSFGCDFHSSNTYFVDALLNQPSILNHSIVQLMEQARTDVAQRERKMNLSPPSSPQIAVGRTVQAWANQPLRDWLRRQ